MSGNDLDVDALFNYFAQDDQPASGAVKTASARTASSAVMDLPSLSAEPKEFPITATQSHATADTAASIDLATIVLDRNEERKANRRLKNREHARNFRRRRQKRTEELEGQVKDLETKLHRMKAALQEHVTPAVAEEILKSASAIQNADQDGNSSEHAQTQETSRSKN